MKFRKPPHLKRVIVERGTTKIPYEALDRTIKYLEGRAGYKRLGHAMVWATNTFSYFSRPYIMRTTADFLQLQELMTANLARVKFPWLEVKKRAVDEDLASGQGRLELTVGDLTGDIRLDYRYTVETSGGQPIPPDTFNDPLPGAQVGNRLQIFNSLYKGDSRIEIIAGWHVQNNKHYERVRDVRANRIGSDSALL
jgi:hypothetical protein